jgi:hypothetical protein
MTATYGHSARRWAARSRAALALTALAITAGAIGGSAATADAAPGCAHSGKQIKRNKQVRVYRKGKSGSDLGGANYYACDLKKGKVTKLNPPADFGGGSPVIKTLKLAGSRVAFAAVIPTGCCSEEELDVIDARKKHHKRSYGAGLDFDHDISIRKIALRANGDVAWISDGCAVNAGATGCIAEDTPDAPPPPNEFQVWGAGHKHVNEVQKLLAHGPVIAPSSIGLTSALVTWTDGGTPMQAPIP